jgi:DNA polymerase III gamma/tau subunit
MRRLSVPQGVRDALDRLDQLLTQPALTERDIAEVLKLVKKSQRLLG